MRKKSKVGEDQKQPTLNKDEIICPLMYHLTKGEVAYNYGVEWAGQTKLTLDNGNEVVGVWRSSVRTGPHRDAFEEALKQHRERDRIEWTDKSWYFTHEEGKTVAQEYVDRVLKGQTKANKKVWDNRFAEASGVSYDELVKRNSDVYKAGGAVRNTETSTEQQFEDIIHMTVDPLDELQGPSDEELLQITDSNQAGVIKDEETVEEKILVITKSETDNQRVSEQRIVVFKNGRHRDLYKVYLEEQDLLLYLEPGLYMINDQHVMIEVIENEETSQAHGGS